MRNIRVGEGNIAGVAIPTFEGAEFSRGDYDLYDTPLWVDLAANHMEKALELDLKAQVLDEQVRLLDAELRATAQRVNLFEKVKIPETQENIRRISIYLADQQVNAVVRSKIAKRKLPRAAARRRKGRWRRSDSTHEEGVAHCFERAERGCAEKAAAAGPCAY